MVQGVHYVIFKKILMVFNVCSKSFMVKVWKLENVTAVNALQLEAARVTPVLFRFNYDAVPTLKSLNLSIAVLLRFCCCYITLRCELDLWLRDLDLWPSTLNISIVSRVTWWNPLPNMNAIEQSAAKIIEISVFDHMTLNIALRVAIGSGIIFIMFDLRQLIRAWIIAFFNVDTLCHAVTLTLDLWSWSITTLKTCSRSLGQILKSQ